MGFFTGMEKVSPTYLRNYFRPGRYWAVVNRCKYNKGFKGESFIVTFSIAHVLDIREENPDGCGLSNKVNEDVTVAYTDHPKYPGMAQSRVKSFVMAATGLESVDIGEEMMNRICNEETQPLANTILEINAMPKLTKEAQKWITEVHFKMGEIDKKDLLKVILPKVKDRIFPASRLERLIEEEDKAAVAAAGGAK